MDFKKILYAFVFTVFAFTASAADSQESHIKIIQMKNSPSILFGYNASQVYKSKDRGEHWELLTIPKTLTIFDMVSVDRNRILLLSGSGLHASDDKGESWFLLSQFERQYEHVTVVNPNLILLSTAWQQAGNSINKSTDNGNSWVPVPNEYPEVTFMAGRDDLLLIASNGLHMSMDNGGSWTQPAKWEKGFIWDMVINGNEDIFLIAGALFKTNLKTGKWIRTDSGIHGNVYKLRTDNKDNLYVIANHQSIYRSTNRGKNWKKLYQSGQIYDAAILDEGNIMLSTEKGLLKSDQEQDNFRLVSRF